MESDGTVDEAWRFYKCKCGYRAAKHIHPKAKDKEDAEIADNMRDYWKHQRCGAE